jgi:transposase-like protein
MTRFRNGYRTRRWDTRVGTIELKIPKATAGAYFPALLEPAGEPRRHCTRWWWRPT